MSIHWIGWVFENGPDDPTDRYVLVKLADNANSEGLCYPSIADIHEKTRLGKTTVRRSIATLERDGWLLVERGRGAGHTSHYKLLRRVPQRNLLEFDKGAAEEPFWAEKVPQRKVSLRTKKGAAAVEKGAAAAEPTPLIEEPSLTVNEPSGQKLSRDKRERTIKTTSIANTRHAEFKEAIADYWKSKNTFDMPWDGSEGKSLGMWLSANPSIDVSMFKGFLRNRYRSNVNHSDRPSMWIRNVTSYAQPVDRFNKPTGDGDGRSRTNQPSPAKQRIDNGRIKLAEIALKRGLGNVAGADGKHDAPVSDAGPGRDGRGVLPGLRAAGVEVLAPARAGSAGGVTH